MLVALTKVLQSLLLPPGLLFVLLLVAVLLALTKRMRAAAVAACVGCALVAALSFPPVSSLLLRPLEERYPALDTRGEPAVGADAIVLLSGGVDAHSPDAGGLDVLSPRATRRTLYAAVLYRRLDLPIIAAGGRLLPDPREEPEAAVAARLLVELGVPAQRISLEDQSRNTWENATRVQERYHPRRVVLVTSAYHMPRAVTCFLRLGIEVVPAPTDYIGSMPPSLLAALPDADALAGSLVALKEYAGIVAYRLLYRPPREAAVAARAIEPDPSGSRGVPGN